MENRKHADILPFCRTAWSVFRWGAGRLLDVILPPRCLACGAVTTVDGALCAECWDAMTFLAPPVCACCGMPFGIEAPGDTVCGRCLLDPPPFRRARAVFRYDDASRRLILAFKHGDQTAGAPAFARWMARAGADLLAETDLIVPVPLHPIRLFSRRYNQAAMLAAFLARQSGLPHCPDALRRRRHTPMQGSAGAGAKRRQDNLRGAIALARPDRVAGRRVLLIDDVFTTGATVGECANVLLAGGASHVDVLTLARVVRTGR